jgi:hypothetical protein
MQEVDAMGFWKRVALTWRAIRSENDFMHIGSFAVGMNSSVDIQRDEHILFLDYDTIDPKEVEESVIELQDFWGLSHCWIFKTKNGHHAIFFYDIMPYSRCLQLIDYAKGVDPQFKFLGRLYGHKTLRVAGKHHSKDIVFLRRIRGVRRPSRRDIALGNLKMREHKILTSWMSGEDGSETAK